ncbi:MAG TPA: glycoside hydrolase domain-containing protein, partial [Planctomycetota bacterium]|nr:glycoside hydrolase domain-containing protein [Planctomycetota bacterium]
MSCDFDLDWGDPDEPLRPVELVGTRNGAFSGKVVVGSREPLRGLSAKVTDLRSVTGDVIGASRVQVRWALPDRSEGEASFRYPAVPAAFDALEETPPDEVPVREKRLGRGTWVLPGQPPCVFGAVQPVWVTVNVPVDAKPGDYTATLAITASGERFDVPVSLAVSAWRLPDPGDFQVFTELVQSPESVAMQYDVPFWSDAHFDLVAKSLDLLRAIGCRTTYLPLVAKTNMGNDESMVRWVKRPDGAWTHDFSILERYLDLVVAHQGRPQIVCVYVWDHHVEKGPVPVTTVDAGGAATEIELPPYGDARSKALWQPVIDGVRERLAKRGLAAAMMFGLAGDEIPSEETVS